MDETRMHPALERQLRKLYGDLESVPGGLGHLLRAVSNAYEGADLDRTLLERALELTSEELLDANKRLRRHSDELERTVSARTGELRSANASLQQEIAERKAAQEARKESDTRYRALADNSPIGIFHSDADGRTLYVNRAWETITGRTLETGEGEGWQQAIHPDDRFEKVREWKRLVEQGIPLPGGEYRLLKPDGSVVWVEGYAVPLRDDEGHVTGYVGSLNDITDHKLAQTVIRESEEKFRALFEQSLDAIYISTPSGEMIDINPAGYELLGFESKTELLECNVAGFYSDPNDRLELLDRLAREDEVRDHELELVRRDGSRVTVLASVHTVRDSRDRVVSLRGILRDITQRKLLERQLLQSQKMEALGRLAGGVAHDFNNLLTAIIGFADLLSRTLPKGSVPRRHAEDILEVGERGAALTGQLLAFSRRQVLEPRVFDVNSVVGEMQTLLRRLIGEDVELVTKLDPDPCAIRTDPTLLEQIIVNLAINARDAMPEGGALTILTSRVSGRFGRPSRPGAAGPRDLVLLTVNDTGEGMDEQVQEKIFEPFFTTKPESRGTGLGLATVYGAVQQSGGEIRVLSELGHGTSFDILFPRVEWSGEEEEALAGSAEPDAACDETILLAEDEPAVRDFLAQLLRRQGYEVLTAADGEEAIELARRHEGAIDLLLSDIVMPKLNGLELARSLRGEMPDLKILLVTGYSENHEELRSVGDALLKKPFAPRTLAGRLRELLDGPRSPERA